MLNLHFKRIPATGLRLRKTMPTQRVMPSCLGHLQDIADTLSKAKKVVVVTGAGISTNLGIPDFRSENGLYSLIQARYDTAAAVAAEKERLEKEELRKSLAAAEKEKLKKERLEKERIEKEEIKKSLAMLAKKSSTSGSALVRSTTTPTRSTRPVELLNIKTRSRSVMESQNARIFTRSQSDLTGRESLPNPDSLLRRTSSSISKPATLPRTSSSKLNSEPLRCQTSEVRTLKRSRSLGPSISTKVLEAPIQRSSKRLKLLHASASSSNTTSSSIPVNSSNTSKQPSPAPETSSQEAISAVTRAVLPKLKGKDLFDAMVWQDPLTTSIFLTFIAELRRQIRTGVFGTSKTHKLIKAFRDGGRLVRCYTQNVDGLESREGLVTNIESGTGRRSRFFSGTLNKPRPDDGGGANFGGVEVVQLHGGLDALRCSLCGEQSSWQGGSSQNPVVENSSRSCSSVRSSAATTIATTAPPSSTTGCSTAPSVSTTSAGPESIGLGDNLGGEDVGDQSDREEILRGGRAPGCQRCIQADEARQHRGRRSVAVGKLRPDVVLYGEEHPEATRIGELVTHDISLGPDVILIMGTSLRVHGLKVMVKEFSRAAHAKGGKVVFVNNTKPPESTWGDVLDYWVQMDCDLWVEDLKKRRGELWLPQGLSVESNGSEDGSIRRPNVPGKLDTGFPKSIPSTKKAEPSTPASEPKLSTKVKRPQCQREDEMNGAYWAYQIQLNLEIIGGRPRTYAPNCNPHRKWGTDKWRRDSGKLDASTTPSATPVPLKSISSNVPRPIKLIKGNRKRKERAECSRAAGSQLQRELSASVGPSTRSSLLLLPTPPPSDETEEAEEKNLPLTPRTRQRIKAASSLERILSSPVGVATRSGRRAS